MSNIANQIDWKPGQSVSVDTERFHIRSAVAGDIDDRFISWWNDAEIQRGLNWAPRGWGRQEALEWVEAGDNRNTLQLVIIERSGRTVIGYYTISINHGVRACKPSVCVGDMSWWGKGVVRETRAALFPLLFRNLGMEKVVNQIYGRNLPSIYNCQAQGYVLEAVERSHSVSPDGGRVDRHHFGLLKTEWEAAVRDGRI